MTQQEIEELRDLRNRELILKEEIHMIESEILDRDMRITALNRSKHGKGVGLILSLTALLISITCLYSYLYMYDHSAGSQMKGYADTVVFSVTATMLPFLMIFVFIFLLTTMILALFLVMDLFPTEGAYRSALRFHRVNIPHEKRVCQREKEEMEKALGDMKREAHGLKIRMEELRKMEQQVLWE